MKIINKILHFALLIIALMVQIAFFEHLEMYFISFDLILIAIVAITLLDGAFYGIIFGFVAGLILDLAVGDLVGVSALVYVLDAFIVWKLVEAGFRSKLISQIFLVFIVTEANLIITNLIRFLFNYQVNLPGMGLDLLILPVFNILLMIIFYPAVKIGISSGLEEFEFKYKNKT
ncbi:MAG: rod shape-determining protein MreD [Actinobacteria bacterium]|nr:rod shape-determining protein MreD [Actinomycetota bacterium]